MRDVVKSSKSANSATLVVLPSSEGVEHSYICEQLYIGKDSKMLGPLKAFTFIFSFMIVGTILSEVARFC